MLCIVSVSVCKKLKNEQRENLHFFFSFFFLGYHGFKDQGAHAEADRRRPAAPSPVLQRAEPRRASGAAPRPPGHGLSGDQFVLQKRHGDVQQQPAREDGCPHGASAQGGAGERDQGQGPPQRLGGSR